MGKSLSSVTGDAAPAAHSSDQASFASERPGWRAWLVVSLLAACYVLAYLDRQIISLLIEPIKRSLSLSDTEFGLMQGISFSLFYAAAALPLAWLADRTRRSRLISACVALWSVMTVLCGFSVNFWQMLSARIGVAIGEAGLTPAALATLADRFDARRLAPATSIFMLAPFVGGGLALGGGGLLYAEVQSWDRATLPVFSSLEAWQLMFVLFGAPGLILAALLLLISDRSARRPGDGSDNSLGELFRFIRKEWRIMVVYALAISFLMTLLASYVTWLPAAIMRSKGVDEATVGALFGPVYLLSGVAGTLSAGVVIMLFGGTDPARSVLRYMCAITALLFPVGTIGLLTDSLAFELVMLGIALFLISSITSLSSLPVQYLTPRHLRAQAIGLLSTVAALFGTGFGPVLAGVMSDNITFARHPLSAALAIIAAVVTPTAYLMLRSVMRQHCLAQERRADVAH